MNQDTKDEVVLLHLDDIIPNRFQPREIFDEKALKELAISIKEHGVIQPIIVRKANEKYEIIAGERRYKASALAGLTKIPAIIRNLDDKESAKVALLENLQRKNLNPIEEARTYQKILELDQLTQEELAKTMGKSQSAVANKIRLLSLSDKVQEALLKEQISERHARALLNISDAKKQQEMLKKIIDTKMSVRMLEEEINKINQKDNSNVEKPVETIATANAFVNNNPLKPTADIPLETSNYGKVTISPPKGEDMSMGKYINYGELEEDSGEEGGNLLDIAPNISTINSTPDANALKEPSSKKMAGADLDNLLNLGNPSSSVPNTQFITPAEKIVKTDPGAKITENSSDYFKIPEFTSINNPNVTPIINSMNNKMFLANSNLNNVNIPNINSESIINTVNTSPEETAKKDYTIDGASKSIRDIVTEFKNNGLNITIDEMDFEKSHQIIIKMDKNVSSEKEKENSEK